MPGFDGTGPIGVGSRTGGGFGLCGYGWRGMFGSRRGLGRLIGPHRKLTQSEKVTYLTEYKQALLEELEDVEAALKNPDSSH